MKLIPTKKNLKSNVISPNSNHSKSIGLTFFFFLFASRFLKIKTPTCTVLDNTNFFFLVLFNLYKNQVGRVLIILIFKNKETGSE